MPAGGATHDQRRRDQQVDAVHELGEALAMAGASTARVLDRGVLDLQRAAHLGRDVLAVELGVLAVDRRCTSAASRRKSGVGRRRPGRAPTARATPNIAATASTARAHQRFGLLGPRQPDLQLVQVGQRGGREAVGKRLHHPLAARHVARHRAGVVEARGQREAAADRNGAVGRLEPDDAAARGRDPHRAAGVRAQRVVGQAGRQCRRAAAAGPPGDPARRDRVRDPAEVLVLRGDAPCELVQVGLADTAVAGRLEPCDSLRGRVRNVVGVDRRAVGGAHPGRVEEVLDGQRRSVRGGRKLRDEDSVHA